MRITLLSAELCAGAAASAVGGGQARSRWAYLGGDFRQRQAWRDILGADGEVPVARARDAIMREEIADFYAWLDRHNERFGGSSVWWLSTLPSRLHDQSSLFPSICYVRVAERMAADVAKAAGAELIIVVQERGLLHVLKQRFAGAGHRVRARGVSLPRRCVETAVAVFGWLRVVVHQLRLRVAFIRAAGPPDEGLEKGAPYLLLYLPFTPRGFAADGRYTERHSLPGIQELLEKAGVRYLLHPRMGRINRHNAAELGEQSRRSNETFVWTQQFCSWGDYIAAALFPLRLALAAFPMSAYKDIDAGILARHELRSRRWLSRRFADVLEHRFAGRLKAVGIEVTRLLGWHENLPVDRAFLMGFRDAFPRAPAIGYHGFVNSLGFMHPYPTSVEVAQGVNYSTFAVCGESCRDSMETFADNIRCLPAPGYRYRHLWETCEKGTDKEAGSIGIVLSIAHQEVCEIVDALAACGLADEGRNIRIKPHPATPMNDLLALLPPRFHRRVVDGPITDLIDSVEVVISRGQSSALVEAVVKGCFVVIFSPSVGLLMDPLTMAPPGCYQVVYDADELREAIRLATPPSRETRRECLRRHFYPVTAELSENLLAFDDASNAN